MNKNMNKNFFCPNLRQVKSGVISFSVDNGGECGGLRQKIKVAHNDLKHISVLEFLRSDEIFKILSVS